MNPRPTPAVVQIVGALLLLLVPVLIAAGPDAGAAAAGVVTALALAAVVHLLSAVARAQAPVLLAVTVTYPPLLRSGSATDPTHHPLRPRAPGRA